MTKFVKREDLDSMNDFVFGKIMSEKTVCKYFLELLPGFEISDLIYLEPQKTLDEQINFKGVRLAFIHLIIFARKINPYSQRTEVQSFL